MGLVNAMGQSKFWLGITAAALAAAVLAGCGSDSKPIGEAGSSTDKPKVEMKGASYTPPQIDTKGLLEKAKDGTYVGKSSADEKGEVGQLTITIENHKITKSEYVGLNKDGSVKGENYGKNDDGSIGNKVYYNKAQHAVEVNGEYAKKLLETQELNKVDGVSGATVSYKQFFEAAQDALGKAAK